MILTGRSFVRGTWLICKKELADIFLSPLIYVLAALFSFILGWLFFNYLMASKVASSQTLTPAVVEPIFGNMNLIFVFLVPLMTMNAFSQEKKNGTLDLLFRSKLSDWQIIAGKFLSQMFLALFLLSFTLVFVIVLKTAQFKDWSIVWSSYFGLILSISCYVSVGLFTSTLTENGIVASLLSFCILISSMILVLSTNTLENEFLTELIQYMTVPFHYFGFSKGVIRSYSLVFFASFTGFFLFLTLRSLERRKW